MQFCLQTLLLAHVGSLLELDRECFGGFWTRSSYQQEISNPASDLLGVLSLPNSMVIGCGCLWTVLDEGHITLLAVKPAYRQQGFGSLLLTSLLQAASQRQLTSVTLEVRATNLVALNLYEQHGFERRGRRRGYYFDPQSKTEADGLILNHDQLQDSSTINSVTQAKLHCLERLIAQGWQYLTPPS